MAVKKTQLYKSLWDSCDELRGGMDASQYKDYILTLLFMKYVTDKFKGQPYAHVTWYSVVLSRLTRTCNRCGYDPLWKPNDDDSKCIRHTYNSWRYDEVFVWSPTGNNLSLEEAFDIWWQSQPTSWDQPVKQMTFGQIGWK